MPGKTKSDKSNNAAQEYEGQNPIRSIMRSLQELEELVENTDYNNCNIEVPSPYVSAFNATYSGRTK